MFGKHQDPVPIPSPEQLNFPGTCLIIFTGSLSVISLFLLPFLIWGSYLWISAPILSAATGALIFLRIRNKLRSARCAAYRNYAAVIGERKAVRVSEIAEMTGKPVVTVRKAIQEMLTLGYLGRSSYLDIRTDTLRLKITERAPERNVSTQSAAAEHTAEKDILRSPQATPERQAEKRPGSAHPEADNFRIDRFDEALKRIRQLQAQIEEPSVRKRIDRIGMLTSGIFSIVCQKSEQFCDVRKFLDYYLPTTFKLLETYSLMEKQGYQSESIKESRQKIEGMLDMLIRAFEKEQDVLLKRDTMDVDAEIRAMQAKLAMDGLAIPNGLDINEFRVSQAGR